MTAVSTGACSTRGRRILFSSIGAGFLGVLFTAIAPALSAAAAITTPTPTPVPTPTAPSINDILQNSLNGPNGTPSDSVVVLIGITLLSVAPSLILMMSSFTKIFIVLAMTRNAMGLSTIPPNQILAGLALFLSIFIMWPVISDINVPAM